MSEGSPGRFLARSPRVADRLGRRSGRSWIVDLEEARSAEVESPSTLILLLLLLCLKDRATQLKFHPYEHEDGSHIFGIWYQVGGELCELVPAPTFLEESILAELERLAGLHTWRGRLARLLRRGADRIDGREPGPASGSFLMGADGCTIAVQARFLRVEAGTRIVLDFPPHNPDRSEFGSKQMRRVLASVMAGEGDANAPA